MRLSWIGNFGETEKVISEKATLTDIVALMDSLDWMEFHQVVLERDSGNWIEIGGSLKTHGLSAVISRYGVSCIIANAPASVGEMKRILTLYFQGDKRITQYFYSPGITNPLPKRISLEAVLKEKKQRLQRRVWVAVILSIILGLIFFIVKEQSKLLWKTTDLAPAEVVDKRWKPGLMGYDLYRISYSFINNEKFYAGIARAGLSAKRNLMPGDPILIRFAVDQPEENAYEAKIIERHNRSDGNVGSRAIKEKMEMPDL